MGNSALFIAVFLACAVEAVEALTIFLAAGVGRGWRSAIAGLLAGLLALTVIVVALGPAVATIPLDVLRLIVGGLLLASGCSGYARRSCAPAGTRPFTMRPPPSRACWLRPGKYRLRRVAV